MVQDKKIKYLNYLLIAIICVPILLYIKTVYHYALNLPREDDYDAILNIFCSFKKASFADRIAFMFQQQCEHRSLFPKLIILSHYVIFGNINFRHIILFDILLLLISFAVLVYFIKRALPGSWHIAAIILSFGLFDLNNFENADFVSAGTFNYGIVMLFLLSVFFYSLKNNRFIILAALSQVVLIYSGGNGMIGALFIVLYTILENNRKKYVTSIVLFLVFTPLYFYHYNSANPNAIYFTLDASKFLPYFFTALGANFRHDASFAIGIIMLLVLLTLACLFRKQWRDSSTNSLVCVTGFVVVSLGIMAIFRANLPLGNSFSSRYLVYSHILVAMIFVFAFIKIRAKAFLYPSALLMVVVYYYNYQPGIGGFESFYGCMKGSAYCYPADPQGQEHAKQVAIDACNTGIYCIEKHRGEGFN